MVDTTHSQGVYMTDDGDRLVVASNGTIDIEEGGTLDLNIMALSLGSQANVIGSAEALSSTVTGVLRSFADDGGASVATSARNIQGRTLLTVDQAGGSIRSVQGQLKMLTGVDLTTGIYTAVQGYVEMAGTHVSQTGATFSCIDASMEITTSMTVDSGGEACGIHVETTGAGTITNNGTCAAILISNASGAAAWPVGIAMVDSDCTIGSRIGTWTTGLTIGTCTTGITVTAATGYALDIQTTGSFRMGVQGTGIPVVTATPFAMEVHTQHASDVVQGATGRSAGIRCRYEISVAQTTLISLSAVEARLRVKAGIADGDHAGMSASIEGDDSIAYTGTSTTNRSAGTFTIEMGTGSTLSAGFLCGITIDSSVHNAVSMASVEFIGLRIKTSSSKEIWEHGIYIDGGAAATGITIGACAGHGVSVSGTFTTASSRSFKSDMTVNDANYGDGYSANEFQLNLTGTGAGHVAAAGSWVNVNSGTHGQGGNFICAQTNGIYEVGAATITGAIIIFGMRMAHQCTDTDAAGYFPFSIVSAGGLNTTTALFHCSAAAINMGAVTDGGSDDGVLVPLYQEAGNNIGYVKIYSLA